VARLSSGVPVGAEGVGRTVEEAVREALRALGARTEDVVVEVLDAGGRGWLGLGARPARVRVRRRSKGEAAARFLERLGALMGLSVSVAVTDGGGSGSGWEVAATVEDPSRWIGRRGQTLAALEVLCEAAASRASGDHRRLSLDVQGYRARRAEAVRSMARRAAEQARRTGRPVVLPAMDARERREVHLAVRGCQGVRSESRGQEPHRRVVVVPEGAEGGPDR
jgi:spoIIIJ-associated protein